MGEVTQLQQSALYLAASLIFAVGAAHSFLGEKYILIRLFRREDLPKLFGSQAFTTRTLRFAWHLTSIAWLGFAVILVVLAHPPFSRSALGVVIGSTFLLHGLVALTASRGRHLSWPVFLAIGAIVIYACPTDLGVEVRTDLDRTPQEEASMLIDQKINYLELPANDFDAVQKFYEGAFGWTFTDYGPEYRAFNDGTIDGGFYKSEASSSTSNGGALIVLYAENLEQTRDTVVRNGGTIVKEIFLFPGGRRFHFADPNGNELAVWSDR